ncbi:hypothetical protein KUCAC02_019083 [Chaenocephalus aceratus]|uniref:Uncharacterized protein n=1 Tax=Chaenocephalus aceratus TaxID=36190 RepID=A0ACB9WBD1_CHAAC|nr:hypothetical protein KUCAC02_019083 [Chaenocephalus aceratus]
MRSRTLWRPALCPTTRTASDTRLPEGSGLWPATDSTPTATRPPPAPGTWCRVNCSAWSAAGLQPQVAYILFPGGVPKGGMDSYTSPSSSV